MGSTVAVNRLRRTQCSTKVLSARSPDRPEARGEGGGEHIRKKRVVGFTGVKRRRQTRPIRTQRDQGSCAIGKLSLDHF